MTAFPFASLLIFLPVAGAALLLFVRRDDASTSRAAATVVMAMQVALAAAMWLQFGQGDGFRFVERRTWIETLGIGYHLGVDGIGLAMISLAAVIGLIAVIAAFGVEERPRDFFLLVLLVQTGIMGVFTALDFVLFFVFWEIVLVPMYFLIGTWGHDRREYAALKFFMYTMAGSVLMMVGILALYLYTGAQTFDMLAIAERVPASVPEAARTWIFWAFFAGFAVKVPVFPLHTWLPDAHVEAPTPISVILAAVLLKLGGFAFLRVSLPILPDVASAAGYILAVLGVISIVYGALVALSQTDFKRVVAYSSVAHMGFVMLGIGAGTETALNGAVYVMIAHGLTSAMLFLLVGVYYDRIHTRDLTRMGGFFKTMPFASTLLAWALFTNLGLPGLAGFIGEFFTFAGVFPIWPNLVYIGLIGLVFITVFSLWTLQRVVMGPENKEFRDLTDANPRERITLIPLAALLLLLGIYPTPVFDLLNSPVAALIQRMAAGF